MNIARWFITALQRRARRRETAEELAYHVDMLVEEKMRDGLDEAEARRQARLELGDVEVVGEQLADQRAGATLAAMTRDVWLAGRSLRRAPFFATVSVLLIALGVAASTTLFTLADGILWRPLPIAQPEQLVQLFEHSAERGVDRLGVARGNLAEWRDQAQSFQRLATSYVMGRTLTDGDHSWVVEAGQVTCDFFPLSRLDAVAGRFFSEDECRRATYANTAAPNGSDPVAVLGYDIWRSDFGGDPEVVGRTVAIDRRVFRIIGVAPPAIAAILPDAELFLAWDLEDRLTHDQRYSTAFGRLRPDVSIATARQELAAIAERLGEEKPATNKGWEVGVVPLHEEATGGARSVLLLLLAAAGLLLAIASGNVAILFLARAMARSRELAMRLALGALPGRVLRYGLMESLVVAMLGGALGVAGSYLALRAVPRLWPDLPRVGELEPDPTMLLVALGGTLASALLAGLVPAWRMARTDPLSAFGRAAAGSRGTATRSVQTARNALVVGEVALTVVLLAASGLLIRSVQELREGEVGFDPQGVLVAPIFLDSAAYDSGAKSRAYYADLFSRLRALPGVEAVGGATALPTSGLGPDFERPVWAEGSAGQDEDVRQASVRMITPGYLEALRVPVVEGRAFHDGDQPGAQNVVMVSQTLARSLWPGKSPIGRQLVVDYSRAGTYPYEVVGVTGDVRFAGPRSEALAEVFFPHAQRSYLILNVAVRSAPGAPPAAAAIRETLAALDPQKPAHGIYPLTDLVGATYLREQRAMQLLVGFAVLATLLSALGVYGLLTYRVRQHAAEIGVRMALGASRRRLVGWVAGHAARLVVLGTLLGLGLAAVGARLLDSLLFGVRVTDLEAGTGVFGVLLVLVVGAALAPAWRAANTQPASVLRRH